MPDFNKDLSPIIAPVNTPELDYTSPGRIDIPPPTHISMDGTEPKSVFDLFAQGRDNSSSEAMGVFITDKELKENQRYKTFNPTVPNYEDFAAYGQGWMSKMVNGVGKGLLLTGTTFLQTTVGALNGLAKWASDGKAASFYDNDLNRWVDRVTNDWAERTMPNYYTDKEKNARWYSPNYWFTANFLWDGIVKNLGFSAGAALSGLTFASVLRTLPLASRLFSIGKGAEALAATEEAIAAGKAAESFGRIKSLSDRFLGSYKVLNPGGRALVAGLATSGEASFEALQNMNQFRDARIKEYMDSHGGAEPTGIELDNINRAADEVGNASYLANILLLSATNYIQFPKILGSSYKVEKGMVNSLSREIAPIVREGEKYIAAPVRGGRILSTLNKIRPYTFSASEAFEEGSQYAITMGSQDYYNKALKGEPTDFLSSVYEGVSQTLNTDEGMKNVLIGGLSGAIMLARGKYRENKAIDENTRAALSDKGINARMITDFITSDFTRETRNSVNRGTALQEEREALLQQDDILNSKDKEFDYIVNYLSPRIQFGRYDLVKSEIDEYRALASTEEGFAQLQQEGKALPTDTREAYLNRLSALESTAENVKSLYQSLNLRYGAKTDDKGKLIYTPEVMNKMVYAASKIADYDKRIPQLSIQLTSAGIDVSTIIQDVLEGKVDSFNKASAAISQMDILDEEKTSLGQALDDVAELSLRRDKFLKEYTEIKKNPEKYKEKRPIETEPLEEKKETVRIKTKTGEKEVEIGTEYFLGRVVEYSEGGKEVYRSPRLTILGENEDGTIKIRDANGNVRDVAKSVLEDYKLAKVSDTLANKKAKFFMEHWNTIYEFNFGKGRKQIGRLEYSHEEGVLNFVYRDKKGRTRSIEVTADQFVPREGFNVPMISAVGELTAVQKKALDEFASQKDERTLAKREARARILTELFDELSEKQKDINELITKKKAELKNINTGLDLLREDIENAGEDVDKRAKKGVKFRKQTRTYLQTAMRLSRMKEQLEREVEELEAERDELEINQSYIADAAQNIDELPTATKDFIEELEYQVELLKETIENNTKQVSTLHRLIDSINSAIDKAMDGLNSLINEFKTKYPKAPLALGQGWIDFLKANPNFLKLKPNYKEDLQALEDLIAETEDFEITPNEEKIKSLQDQITALESELSQAEKELEAKELILSRFKEIAKKHEEQKAQEEIMAKREEIFSKLGTSDSGIQTREFNKDYEPEAKKADDIIGNATTTTGDKPHAVRSNRFGVKLSSFPNRKKIRGVYITAKNEGQLIPGLIDHLRTNEQGAVDETIDRDSVIALVMVELNDDGTFILVDENGVPLKEGADLLNSAIYQTMPLVKKGKDGKLTLMWSNQWGEESMFRATTPDEVRDTVTDAYVEKRKRIIDASDTIGDPHEIEASFGFPQYITYLDEGGKKQKVYTTRTSVEDAGFVDTDDMQSAPVILIPTVDPVAKQGTVTYNDAIGVVFLELPNGLVKLQNRQHTKREAETVYKAILQMAKNMLNPKEGLESDNSKRLFNYLRSVVYWGIPKDQQGREKPAGYNSIFWKKDESGKFVLYMSGKGQTFPFTPSGLEQNKAEIITMLEGMYNNINSSMVKNISEPYEEVLDITPEGEIVSRKWANYQSYLLSKTFIPYDSNDKRKGEERTNEELPLTTLTRPLENKDDVNREGVYFYTTDSADRIVPPAPKKVAPKTIKPVSSTNTSGTYKADGKTINVFTSKEGKQIKFVAFSDVNDENFEEKIKVIQGGDLTEVMTKLEKEKEKLPEDQKKKVDIKRALKKQIYNSLKTQLSAREEEEMSFVITEEDLKGTKSEGTQAQVKEEETSYTIEEEDLSSEAKDALDDSKSDPEDGAFRTIIEEKIKNTVTEDWGKVEEWLKTHFPNIPVYRVKNVIRSTNGRQLWGMFRDGAIYIYQNAEVGTAYHEVFHAVWRIFTGQEEQESILNEFRARQGTFYDRLSQSDVKYSEATDKQAEDRIAEEFRDYVQDRKTPIKPAKGRPFILKLFADLVTYIRHFFIGKDATPNTNALFAKIGEGYYATHSPYAVSLSLAKEGIIDIEDAFTTEESAFRTADISDRERGEIIQNMTYHTLAHIVQNDKSLFQPPMESREEMYKMLKEKVLWDAAREGREAKRMLREQKISQQHFDRIMAPIITLLNNIDNQWDRIVIRHEEYLRSYSIEFDENDLLQVRNEDKVRESDNWDATKIDHFRKANSAIKLLLSTIPKVDSNEKMIRSSVGGAIILPLSHVYITLMNRLHSSSSVEEMMARLQEIAKNDANYRALYKRLTKSAWNEGGVDLSKVNTQHGAQLLGAFWRTFKKQNPEVKNVFILENGDIVVGDANLSTLATQLRSEYINSIILTAKKGGGLFVYSEKERAYVGDPAKIKNVKLDSLAAMTDFLDKLGISFTVTELQNRLNPQQQRVFREAVAGIRESISKAEKIATFSGTTMSINGRLLELAITRAIIENPEFDSTFFNIAGERTQSFIGTNPADDLYNFLSSLETFDETHLTDSRYRYLWTDSFAKGSNILKRMFTDKGTRKAGSEGLLRVGYVSGVNNERRGRKKESARLTYRERLIEELNLNLTGWYLNLVPGDSSTEWMMQMGNAVSLDSLSRGMDDVNPIFREYFVSELNLAREGRQVEKGRNSKDMRFFKAILGEELHSQIIKEKGTPEEVYGRYEKRIVSALEKFVNNESSKFERTLQDYSILRETEEGFELADVKGMSAMSVNEKDRALRFFTVNYMVANIELHKLLYSDPYQYSQELKRIKSFNSPRQALLNNSPKMNSVLNKVWNKGFKKGETGYTNFLRDYFRSATHDDISGVVDLPLYKGFDETDGAGIISLRALRQFRIRAGEWNDREERQYRYDIAWEKNDKGLSLTEEEKAILSDGNPYVSSVYTPLKPIVAGSRLNERGEPSDINDVVLDKFALYVLSYRVMKELNPTSNMLKLHEKMQKEDIDYIVFKSARKVGAKDTHSTYKEGEFNDTPYSAGNIINVPFSIMSVQSEVPSKEEHEVTRGSQVTKLVTMDFMEAGVPIDFETEGKFADRYKNWYAIPKDERVNHSPLYKEIKHNQELLEAMMREGYKRVLNRLGIEDRKGELIITDFSDAVSTLRSEILSREVNDNISDALTAFENGKAILESTPAYQQVRNILYSIADKEVVSPKLNGGLKVQIPSSLLESERIKETEINGKKGYTSDTLEFYKDEDGKRVCEMMVGRWFESDMTDDELLEYFKSDEGKKILSGIAFRIPTQKQNSIDSIVIKKLLPREFGDSVVVPAALVEKAGSDFDIDKLSIYLKNIFKDENGSLRLAEYKGTEEATKAFYSDIYDKTLQKQIEKIEKNDEFRSILTSILFKMSMFPDITIHSLKGYLSKDEYYVYASHFDMIYNIIDEAEEEGMVPFEYMMRQIDMLEKSKERKLAKKANEQLRNKWVDSMYRKSLENEYIETMQNLVSHPLNFARLTKPNSSKQLETLSEFIAEKTVGSKFDYKAVGNMLDRGFMTRLRYAFVSGKFSIGIAAVNQTNHSLNQRQPIVIDSTRLNMVSDEDKHWLTDDIDVKFEKVNRIDGKPTLSMIKNADGQDISDILAQFIDGYVDISNGPWIMEMGAHYNVASTYLFLIKLGVPVDTVVYFMNQPIVRDYLRRIDAAGYSWLFIQDYVDDMAKDEKYALEDVDKEIATIKTIPSKATLRENVGKTKFTKQEKAEQHFILKEMLKYAKMANQLFLVTQGSNFDTATFSDPYLIFKKTRQMEKARNTIISSVDDLLENSFVGELGTTLGKIRNALALILKSDHTAVRDVIQKVLDPYTDLNDRDFIKLAHKAVNDLFDWAVQTGDEKLNADIRNILITSGGVATEAMEFVNQIEKEIKANPNHPLKGNQVIALLKAAPSPRAERGGVNNLKVKGRDNKVYDQNNIIYAFRELRDYLKGKSELYNRIKLLAILQSGLSNSAFSFTSLLPYEDFEEVYNKVVSRIEQFPGLDRFHELGVFERNNWDNDDVVPYMRARWRQTTGGWRYNPAMLFLPYNVRSAVNNGKVPNLLTVAKYNRESNSDYIVFSWEKQGEEYTKGKKAQMRKAGDFSYIQKGLFKKVKDNYGAPLIHSYTNKEGRTSEYFVYKAINAWGDGYRANEFYDTDHQSVIENGFVKVKDVDNNTIISLFKSEVKQAEDVAKNAPPGLPAIDRTNKTCK